MLTATASLDRISSGADTDWMFQAAKRNTADGALLMAMDNILILPSLSSKTREAFRTSLTELSKRLNTTTRTEDATDDANQTKIPEFPYSTAESQADQRLDRIRAGLRAACHLAILELIGLPEPERVAIAPLVSRARKDELTAAEWRELGQRIAQAWTTSLQSRFSSDDPAQADLISIVYPGFLDFPQLDSPPGGIRVVERRRDWQQAFTWLATVYLRAARSSTDADFLHRLAETTASAGHGLISLPEIRTAGPIMPLILTADKPSSETVVPLIIPPAISETPTTRLLLRSGILDAQVDPLTFPPTPDGASRSAQVKIQASSPLPANPSPMPDALILEIATRDWSQFLKIPLDTSRLIRSVSLVISRDARNPAALGDQAIFRPGTLQPLYFLVKNLKNEPRQLSVQLFTVPTSGLQIESKVTLAPGETKLVPFAGPPYLLCRRPPARQGKLPLPALPPPRARRQSHCLHPCMSAYWKGRKAKQFYSNARSTCLSQSRLLMSN